ncbi:MAG: phosphoglycerate dehydrogenase [Pseudomonadota bacterium]
MSLKAIICDKLREEGLEVLRGYGIEPVVATGADPGELAAMIGDFDAAIVRSRTRIGADTLQRPGNLKVIGRAGTGVDNIDIAAATRLGIVVMNAPGANSLAAAEHTLALMLALSRHVARADRLTRQGCWGRESFMGDELHNRVLGIIGMGNVGRLVCERARAFKMEILAYDPFLPPETTTRRGAQPVALDELLARSDYISVHTPLTSETRNLLDARALSMVKDGVRIINCARGGIIDESALHAAIVSGRVAGAALDVFNREPPTGNPLLDLEQVVVTPHLGASSRQAQIKVARAIAEQIAQYLIAGTVCNAVNLPPISAQQMEDLGPWLVLAEKLGSFQAQTFPGAIAEVEIEYAGELAAQDTAPLGCAVLKGLLSPFLAQHVTLVNAPVLAKERGIRVLELTSAEAPDYSSLLSVRLGAAGYSTAVAGSVFGRKELRIVRIGELRTEATPTGNILFIRNYDRPGVVGGVGTTLAQYKINIAKMHLGRSDMGGIAVCLVQVDGEVPEAALAAVQGLPEVISAQVVRL